MKLVTKLKTKLTEFGRLILLSVSVLAILIQTMAFAPAEAIMEGGTGYFISNDGYILTNQHVVVNSGSDTVLLEYHGAYRTAKIVYVSKERDIAVLKMDSATPCLNIAKDRTLKEGDSFTALIYDRQLGQNFFTAPLLPVPGKVYSNEPDLTFEDAKNIHYPNVAVSSAFSRPGNSGSPVIDPVSHEVTGMVFGSAGGLLFGMFPVYVASFVLQSADIHKVIADSKASPVCTKTANVPINDIVRIIVFVKPGHH